MFISINLLNLEQTKFEDDCIIWY